MKRIIFLLLAAILSAKDFNEVLKGVEKSYLLKAKSYETRAKEELLKVAKSKGLLSVDISFDAIRLKDTPVIYFHSPQGILSLPMGTKSRYEGEISISYPIFTGYAVTNLIEKSKINLLISKLYKKNLKRELFLKTASLYGDLYALNAYIDALKEAKRALDISFKKAQGFYQKGLIPISDLYNIEAKRFDVESKVEELRAKREAVSSYLNYLCGFEVKEAFLKEISLPSNLDIEKREDILALKEELLANKKDIDIAKSSFYPKIGLRAALKKFGNTLALEGDGYTNANKSYVGLSLKYNIYQAGGDKSKIEAARYKYLAKESFLKDYIRRAKSDLESNINILSALKAKKEAAIKQVEAARSYYELTLGRYKHQLVSADELSRSIASLAEAKAKKSDVESKIFAQKCKILLLSSLKRFKKALH